MVPLYSEKEEHRLKLFEKWVLRTAFGPERGSGGKLKKIS
jgi:hypothetical protein